jgi:peptide/nickel transport system substrate-binding protein
LSQELVSNVYETLITYNGEQYYAFTPVLATNVPDRVAVTDSPHNITAASLTGPAGSQWQSGSTVYICVGYNDFNGDGQLSVGDVIYLQVGVSEYRAWYIRGFSGGASITLSLERYTYLFHIHTGTINFYDETGAVVDTFDINDVKYALTRGMVQDQTGSPQWMFFKPLLGTMDSSLFYSNTTAPTAMTYAHLLDNIFEISGNDLTLNLGLPFPDNAFKQTLANTWGSIVSQQFSLSIGCWDGNLYTDANANGYPDWWTGETNPVRRISRSPYDTTEAYRWVGTGPYSVTVYDSVGLKVVLQRNSGWWQGWPFPGRKSQLSTIELDYISDWNTRKVLFSSGALDICDVPRSKMFELLNNVTKEPDPAVCPTVETIKQIVPTLTAESVLFTFTVADTSPYIGSGSFPDGIPTDFFNNTHVRKAFAYSFNTTRYTAEAWFGEADYRNNMFVLGLVPDYYNASIPGYNINYAAAEAELKAAIFYPGTSVWNSGFTLTMAYDTGNDQRRIVCEMTRDFFQTLSTYDGRSGYAPFVVNIVEVDWSTYLGMFVAMELPIFSIGWHADFADADNFVRPYMHSNGDYSYVQGYTADNGWGNLKDILIDQALVTADGPATARQGLYQQLQLIYYNDCPSYPVNIPQGRRWCQYWVRGWYYNAVYPGDYYGCMYKEDVPWEDVTGAKAGVPDGRVNIFDLSYEIEHFNAKAPVPGWPIDPKWVGAYGNGCPDVYGDRVANGKDISAVVLNYGRGFPQEQEHGGSVDLAAETSNKVVEINYDVTVAVKVKNVVNLTGYEMCLLYDGSLLELESWIVEPIPGWNLKIDSNKSGSFGSQKYLLLDVLSGDFPSALSRFSGDATLVTLLFKGLAEGNATLDISRSTLGVSDTDPVGGLTYIRGKIYNAINDAVSVAPPVYDIAIDNMTSKSVIGRGYCANISTALSNYGTYTETLNVTAYCNTTNFANLTDLTLANRTSTSRVLVWNTTGFAYGNYTIWAYAEPLLGEIDVKDNNCTCGLPVHVGVPGDISGPMIGFYDGTCNMRDIQYLILYFNTIPSSPNWKPNADINNDATVNMRDITIAILNFNKQE